MSNVNPFAKEIAAAEDQLADQLDKDAGGNFEYEPPAAGPCFARLVSYIEYGNQPQRPYKGQPKPDARMAILQFELAGKKHRKEIEDSEGNKRIVYPIITERITLKSGERSNSYKLAAAMAYGRAGKKNMAQFLGESFRMEIIHNEVEKDGNKRVYANIRDSGGWKVSAPVNMNEDGESIPVTVPPTDTGLRLLLWDAPSMQQWDSLFIDGTRTVKRDGKEVEESRNWIQELALSATDFEGSPLQQLLLTEGGALPGVDAPEEPQEKAQEPDPMEIDDTPTETEKPTDEAPDASVEEFDPLAGLDL